MLPIVVLATAATVIASQAVITGAYSLVHQAIQLGLLPRLTILHTSASHAGQIYIPRVTIALMIGVLLLVGLFRTSSALASAYGIAVATTMVVDGILAFVVIWKGWRWSLWQTLLLIAPFVVVDVVFFSANFLKLFEGAWAPLEVCVIPRAWVGAAQQPPQSYAINGQAFVVFPGRDHGAPYHLMHFPGHMHSRRLTCISRRERGRSKMSRN